MKEEYFRLQLFAEGAEGDGAAAGDGAAETEGQDAERLLEQQPETMEDTAPEPQPDRGLVDRHWQGVEQIYQALADQADGLKQLYPDFDLRTEMRDPRFAGMLRCGVDMRSAYHALHSDEILPAAMQYAAKTVEQRLAGAMLTRRERPAENGLRSGGAVAVGSNAGTLSRQDYARICRMVERGERVSFG